jgi:hypothetical protein
LTDLEFDVLDELYFLISYKNLIAKLMISESDLDKALTDLISKNWVKYYSQTDGIENPEIEINEKTLKDLLFLASKKGLMAHNSK